MTWNFKICRECESHLHEGKCDVHIIRLLAPKNCPRAKPLLEVCNRKYGYSLRDHIFRAKIKFGRGE